MNQSDQTVKDLEHIKLLSIFHYVLAGLMYFVGCSPIIHFILGICFLTGIIPPNHPEEETAMTVMGCAFLFFSTLLTAGAWTLATLVLTSGRKLSRRISYKYCFVIACIMCIFMPMGTILGVFTIITLNRQSVKVLFDQPQM